MKKLIFFACFSLITTALFSQYKSPLSQIIDRKINKINGVKKVIGYKDGVKEYEDTYDREGNVSSGKNFDSSKNGNGSLTEKTVSEYNSAGLLTYMYFYNKEEKLTGIRKYEYSGNEFKSLKVYNPNSEIIQEVEYESNTDGLTTKLSVIKGSELFSCTYLYNDQHRLKEKNKYNRGSLIETGYYTYDSNGLLKTQIIRDKIYRDNKIKTTYSYEYICNPLSSEIKDLVEKKINSWQRKGKFEKSDDYNNRVNEITRKVLIEKITQSTIDSLGNLYSWRISSYDYDADNETYKIEFDNFGTIFIKMPVDKAQEFEKNIVKCKFEHPQFSFSNGSIVLNSLTVRLKKDIYTYNNVNQYIFNSSDFEFDPITVELPNHQQKATSETSKTNLSIKSDVDTNIPVNKREKTNTYALVIGNEDYSSFQTDLSNEVNVDFAANDARVFKEYCTSLFGIPEKQVKLLINATSGQMNQGIAWLVNLMKLENGNADIIIYYSGHGLPDEQTKEPYLIPVDISGINVTQGVKLTDLYKKLNEFPSKKITVFLDACFSGGARNQGLVAMKGVKVKPKENTINGNMVVFASSSGEESSGVYRDKQHGYMTYFLLKKLKETNGDISYKDMANAILDNVRKEAALNGKIQTPQTNYSSQVENSWELWKFK